MAGKGVSGLSVMLRGPAQVEIVWSRLASSSSKKFEQQEAKLRSEGASRGRLGPTCLPCDWEARECLSKYRLIEPLNLQEIPQIQSYLPHVLISWPDCEPMLCCTA